MVAFRSNLRTALGKGREPGGGRGNCSSRERCGLDRCPSPVGVLCGVCPVSADGRRGSRSGRAHGEECWKDTGMGSKQRHRHVVPCSVTDGLRSGPWSHQITRERNFPSPSDIVPSQQGAFLTCSR